MLGFAGAGLFAHGVFLYYRAINSQTLPLSSEADWYLVAAWILAAIYLPLTFYHPRTPFGLILMPLVLGLIGTARFFAEETPLAQGKASQTWGMIHGGSLALAAAAVLLGFSAGVLYWIQARRLKRKLPPGEGLRLPSLEWLHHANSRSLVAAVLMLGIGVASGVVLNVISHSGSSSRLPWNDPLILATVAMFVWLAVSVAGGALYKPAFQGRKVVYLTMASFLALLLALAVGLFFQTDHWGKRARPDDSPVQRGVEP